LASAKTATSVPQQQQQQQRLITSANLFLFPTSAALFFVFRYKCWIKVDAAFVCDLRQFHEWYLVNGCSSFARTIRCSAVSVIPK